MALNIKNDVADKLVAEVAELTGETKTEAVIESLRQRLVRERQARDRQELAADLIAIGKKSAAFDRKDATPHGELLYDDHGMPR